MELLHKTLSNKEKTTALQRSIETGNTLALNLLHPTRYKQHNPNLSDGIEAIAAIHDLLPRDKVYAHVVRAFEDGDYSFVHVDYHLFGPVVAFDIHRYEDGIAVEHWDNLQETPPHRNKSGHTMTDGKTQATDHDKTAENKALVERFVREALLEDNWGNSAAYFDGDVLVQHNPHMSDGVAEYQAIRDQWRTAGTPASYESLHKVLGEGNFVLTLSEGQSGGRHSALYDLFRVSNGKIAEHWDVIEEIPAEEKQQNSNGKF